MSRFAYCILALAAVFPLSLGFAGEEKGEPKPPPKEDGAAPGAGAEKKPAGPKAPQVSPEERRKNFQRVREILMKNRKGEEITAEDRAFIKKNAPRMERMLDQRRGGQRPGAAGGQQPGGERRGGFGSFRDRMRRDPMKRYIAELNIVDRASLTAATTLFRAEAREEALAILDKVNETSPDTEAVGFARLLMGTYLQQMEKPEKAKEMFLAVTGRATPFAMMHLFKPDQIQGKAELVIATVKQMMATQKSAIDRCRVVQAMLDGLDRINLEPKARAEVLKAIAGMVSHEDAMANKEVLAKEREAYGDMFRGMNPMMGRESSWRRRGMDRGPEKGREAPGQAMKRRMKEMGDVPPERRRETIEQMKANIRKKLEALGEGGDPEVRERLEKNLEKIDKLEKKIDKKNDGDAAEKAEKRAKKQEEKERKKAGKEGKEEKEKGPVEGAQF